jgi:hypothetical protein
MSTQATVRSVESLKDLRSALALFAEDTQAALGAVDMELRRVTHWLQYDRPIYWQNRLKRLREEVATARAEVFRRKLAKTADYTPAFSEQKELLKRAEAALRDAEARAAMVKKWGPALQQAVLEYHASSRRISDIAGGDVPRALGALTRMVDALEAYLSLAPPSGSGAGPPPGVAPPPLDAIAEEVLGGEPEPQPEPAAEEPPVEEPGQGAEAGGPA